jgi:hypothetical protein
MEASAAALKKLRAMVLWCEGGIGKRGLVESRLSPAVVLQLKGRIRAVGPRKQRGPVSRVDDEVWLEALAARADLVPWHVARLRTAGLRVDEALQVTERCLVRSQKVTAAAVARLVALTDPQPREAATDVDRWHLVLTGPKGRYTRTLEISNADVELLRDAWAFAASKGRRALLWPEVERARAVRKVTNVFAGARRALRPTVPRGAVDAGRAATEAA